MRRPLIAAAMTLALGCNQDKAPAAPEPSSTSVPAPQTTAPPPPAVAELPVADGARAEVGKPAPEFTLPDLDGKRVALSSFKGKTVVLEWFNPGCPFVQRAHTKGSLKDAAKTHQKEGVVWLAVNSGAPGKQGHGVEANREGAARFGLDHPILLDETGAVGRAYGATNTPHMMVIDPSGTLVYRGAIDNSPDAEGESPTGGTLVRYVDVALADLAAHKSVATSETKAYGCSVKYAH